MRVLLIICYLAHCSCAPKLQHLSGPCKEHLIYLSNVIKFDEFGKYYFVKPAQFSAMTDKQFFEQLKNDFDCTEDWDLCPNELVRVLDAERLFHLKLENISFPGAYYIHSGKGVMEFSAKEISKLSLNPKLLDLVFIVTQDGKYIRRIQFSCDLY
jgi:hypothetical protein